MDKIIFYSTHCPKCKVLETKLKQKGISYEEINDVDKMIALGIKSAPCLQVGDKILVFAEAVSFINNK